jgi:hypothetical protein
VYNPLLRRKRQKLLKTRKDKCHGLVQCTKCDTRWNRDVNAARNIWRLAYCAIRGDCVPQYLQRQPAAAPAAAPAAPAVGAAAIVADDSSIDPFDEDEEEDEDEDVY